MTEFGMVISMSSRADLGHPAALLTVEHDVVAQPVRRVREDEDAREQVGQRVPGGEADGDADDAGRRQPRGQVDLPGHQNDVDAGTDDQQAAQDLVQRDRLGLDPAEVVGVARQRVADGVADAPQRAHPEERRHRAHEEQRQEDRNADLADDRLVQLCLRLAGQREARSTQDPLQQNRRDHGVGEDRP